jgi:uncharacterized FlaG/YvyC family protein
LDRRIAMETVPVQHVPQVADAVNAVSVDRRLPDQRELIQAVATVNKSALLGQDKELTFQMDRDIRQVIIKVVNRQTREVLQQIPPEYVLDVAKALQQHA